MTIGNVKMRNISHMLFVSEVSRQLNQLAPFKEAINRQGALLSWLETSVFVGPKTNRKPNGLVNQGTPCESILIRSFDAVE